MIFLCFSGKERLTIVRSILYHLKNYGLKVWFDNHEYILGDEKVSNYTKAIIESKYAIVVYSNNFDESPGALEELEVIYKRYQEGNIHIFPILYNILATEVSIKHIWLCDLIYNELTDKTGSLLTCNQIIDKYLTDLIITTNCFSFSMLKNLLTETNNDTTFLKEMLDAYHNTSQFNINCRVAILYSIFLFVKSRQAMPTLLEATARYIFNTTKLDINYEFKEIHILESVIALASNIVFNKSLQEYELLYH